MSPFSALLGVVLVFFATGGHWFGWMLIAGFMAVAIVGFAKALLR